MKQDAVTVMRCFNGIFTISAAEADRGLYLDNYNPGNRFLVHLKSLQSYLHVPHIGY